MLLDKALRYAEKGWFVFPCREYRGDPWIDERGVSRICMEKSPYIKNGLKDATRDEFKITSWWKKWPNACIAVSCEPSNLFLIDVDTKNGKKGIDNYMRLGIDDRGCLKSLTPSSGMHFVWSGTGKTRTNILSGNGNNRVLSGIDTRGKGGYFIVPPSKILQPETKGNYTVINDWNATPEIISETLLRKLESSLVYNYHKKSMKVYEPTDENIKKAMEALNSLPNRFLDSYQEWLDVGISLYSLGDQGLLLWDDWSSKSDKYEKGVCERKWETFSEGDLTLASLFFWAKESGENGK